MSSLAMTEIQEPSAARVPQVAATFEAYVKTFELPENAVLAAFRKLVYAEHHLLEYSVKLEAGKVYPARFAMIYDGDMRVRIDRIIEFYKEVVAASTGRLDASLVAAIVRGLDLTKVPHCACGFDLRPGVDDCRFKFWARIQDQPLKVDQLLELYGAPSSVLDLILGNELPIGCDMDLRGNTRLKLYPSFTAEDRANRAIRRRLEAVLSPATLAIMPRVERLNVSFDPDHSRILHLQLLPHQLPAMLAELGLAGHPVIERAHGLGLRVHVVSFPESALANPMSSPINLYFIPRPVAGQV